LGKGRPTKHPKIKEGGKEKGRLRECGEKKKERKDGDWHGNSEEHGKKGEKDGGTEIT